MPDTANAVDERIVEAKFDATKFEQGVNKTIKKLDELKDSLNLKGSEKSITQLADETSKATEKTSQALDQLNNRLTTFTGMIKQKIIGGLADQVVGVFSKIEHSILGLAHTLSTQQIGVGLSKYETMLKSVRTILASKSGENAISESDAYEAVGELGRYADETSYSLDQMTDAMSKMVAAGVDINVAKKSVQGIANACAIAGVNATDAARAFFNLSQAYSSGYLKYTDYRSLQLLNMTNERFENELIAAAEKRGTLKGTKKDKDGNYIAWKTAKTADNKKVTAGKTVTRKNLSEALRYNIVDTAVMDELFGRYQVSVDKYKDLLRQYQKSTEEGGLGLDYDEAKVKALEELRKEYGALAVDAFVAAREARSFNDVLLTLTDSISRGWNTTFELIFGKLTEAADFFTWMTEGELAEAIYNIGTWRNDMLTAWSSKGMFGMTNGQQHFIDTIKLIDEILGKLINSFTSLVPDAQNAGEYLQRFSIKVHLAVMRLNENVDRWVAWLNSPIFENGPTRIQQLGNALSIVGRILGIVTNIAGKAVNLLAPVLGAAFDVAFKLLGPIANLAKNDKVFTDITDSFDNLATVLEPIIKFGSDVLSILGDVGAFFLDSSISMMVYNINFIADAIGLFFELITGKSAQSARGKSVLEDLKKQVTDFGKSCKDAADAVGQFFSALLTDLRNLFGLSEEAADGTEQVGFFSNLKNFFDTNQFLKDAEAWINQAKIDVENWIRDLPNKVKNFADRVYSAIFGLFYTKKSETLSTGEHREWYEATDLKKSLEQWFENIKTNISNFVNSIPGRIQNFFNNIPNVWNTITSFIFGKKEEGSDVESSKESDKDEEKITATLDEWFEQVRNSIKEFIISIPSRLADLGKQLYETIWGIFYKKETSTIDSGSNAAGRVKITKTVETPFKKWINGIKKTITKWLDKLPKITLNDIFNRLFFKKGKDDKGNEIIEKTGFTTFLDSIFGEKQVEDARKKIGNYVDKVSTFIENVKKTIASIFDRIKNAFAGQDILANIKDVFDDVFNFILSIFTGTTDKDINLDWLANSVANAITWVKTKAEEVWPKVKDFITSIPQRIANIFTGGSEDKKEANAQSSPVGEAIRGLGESVGKFISDLPNTILEFIGNAFEQIGIIWDNIYKALSGEDSKSAEELQKELKKEGETTSEAAEKTAEKVDTAVKEATSPNDSAVKEQKSKWETFVENLGNVIRTAFENIPKWIAEGLTLAANGIQWALDGIAGLFDGANADKVIKQDTDKLVDSIAPTEGIDKKESSGFAKAIIDLGKKLYEIITVTIPKFIESGIEYVKTTVGGWWDRLGEIFNEWKTSSDTDTPGSIKQKIGEIGSNIYNALTNLPTDIKNAIDYIANGTWKQDLHDIFESWATEESGDGKKSIKNIIGNFGLNLYKWISSLKEKIKAGIEEIKKWWNTAFGNKEEPKQPESTVPPMMLSAEEVAKRAHQLRVPLEKIQKESTYFPEVLDITPNIPLLNVDKKETEKSEENILDVFMTSWNSIMERIGEYAKQAFVLVGPYIIQGWNSTIEFVAKAISKIRGLATGEITVYDLIDDVFGEGSSKRFEETIEGFKSNVVNLGDEIKTTFTTLTEGMDFGGLTGLLTGDGSILNLFGGFFGDEKDQKTVEEKAEGAKKTAEALSDAANDVAKEAGKTDDKSVEAVYGGFSQLFSSISNFITNLPLGIIGNLALVMAVIIALTSLVKQIKETLTFTDEMEAVGSIVKWGSLGILFSGFLMLINWIKDLTAEGDPQKLQHAKDILHILEGIFGLMAVCFGAFAVNGFFEWREAKAGQSLSNAQTAVDMMGSWKKLFTVDLANATSDIADAGSSGVVAYTKAFFIEKIAQGIVGTILNILEAIAESMGNIMLSVDTALSIYNDAIHKIDEIDKYMNDNDIGEKIKRVVKSLLELSLFKENDEDYGVATETAKQKITDTLAMLTDISGALSLFKQSFSTDQNVTVHFDEMMRALNDLVNMRVEILAFGHIATTTTYQDFKYGLTSLGVALSAFNGVSFENLDPNDTTALEKSVKFLKLVFGNDEIKGLAELLDPKIFPDVQDSFKTSEKIGMFAIALNAVSTASKELSSDAGQNIKKLFDAVKEIDISTDKNEEGIPLLALQMGTLGNALGSFAKDVTGLTTDNIENAQKAIAMVLRLAITIDSMNGGVLERIISNLFSGEYSLTSFAAKLKELGPKVREFLTAIDYDDQGNPIEHNIKNVDAVGLLLSRIGIAFGTLNSTSFNTTLLETVSNNLPALGTALRKVIAETQQDTSIDYSDMNNVYSAFRVLIYIAEMTKTINEKVLKQSGFMQRTEELDKFINTVLGGLMVKLSGSLGALYNTISMDKLVNSSLFSGYINKMSILLGNVAYLLSVYQVTPGLTSDTQTSQNYIDQVVAALGRISYWSKDINEYVESFDNLHDITGFNKLVDLIALITKVVETFRHSDVILGASSAGYIATDITYAQFIDEMLTSMTMIDWAKLDILAGDIAPHEKNLDLVKKAFDTLASLAQIVYNLGVVETTKWLGIQDSITRVGAVQSIIDQLGMIDFGPLKSVVKQLSGSLITDDDLIEFSNTGKTIGQSIADGIQALFDGDGTDKNPGIKIKVKPEITLDNSGINVNTDSANTEATAESVGSLLYIVSILQTLDEMMKESGVHLKLPSVDVSGGDASGADSGSTDSIFETVGALLYIMSILQTLDEMLRESGVNLKLPSIDVSEGETSDVESGSTDSIFESIGALLYIASIIQAISGMTVGSGVTLTLPTVTPSEGDASNSVTSMVDYLSSVLLSEEEKAKLTELGKEVGRIIAAGIQAAFDGDGTEENPGIQVKIRPILSMEDLTSQVNTEDVNFNASNGSMTVNLSTDVMDRMSIISEQINTSNERLQDISNKVESFNDNLARVASAITSMDLYLDSGKLVGGIMPYVREELDWEDFISDRGGTIPSASTP